MQWDTSNIPDGLYRVAATTRDRAGNVTQSQWQVVLPAKRRQCPPYEPGSRDRRCYAGSWAGAYNSHYGAYLSRGVQAQVRPPAAVGRGPGFSYLGMGLAGVGQTFPEAGPTNDYDLDSRLWELTAAYTNRHGEQQQNNNLGNVSEPGVLSPQTRRIVAVLDGNQRGVLRYQTASGSMRTAIISKPKRSYFIGRVGVDSDFQGESDRYGRYLSGQYSSAKYRTSSGWVANGEAPFHRPGYSVVFFASDIFCVHSPNIGCP